MKRKIINLISIIFICLITLSFTNVKAASTLTNIDYPRVNEEITDNLKVQGWVMSTVNTTIKAYIDNTEISLDRVERPDVLKAITGYGNASTNPTPGFFKNINITSLSYGNHTLKINVLDSSNNLIQTTTRNENIQAPVSGYTKTIDMRFTSYCLCKKCCGKSPSDKGYGVTASGYVITPGKNEKIVAITAAMADGTGLKVCESRASR